MNKFNNKKYINYTTIKTLVIITLLVTLISLFGITSINASAEKNTIANCINAVDIVKITKKNYPNDSFNDNYEPIGIGPVTLKNGTTRQDAYIVTLLGTKFVYDDTGWQSTDLINDILAGFDLNNPYFNNVKSRIFENIPAGSKLILSGHSLGGMICQEIIADKDIKNTYQIINTLTFGSPLCAYNEGRAGNIIRLCDTWDPIPLLSKYTLTNYEKQFYEKERMVEDGGYGLLSLIDAHTKSYSSYFTWGKYDAFGIKGGKNQVEIDVSKMKYFPTPMFK